MILLSNPSSISSAISISLDKVTKIVIAYDYYQDPFTAVGLDVDCSLPPAPMKENKQFRGFKL